MIAKKRLYIYFEKRVRAINIGQKQFPGVPLHKVVLKICSKFPGEHPYNFTEITLRHGRSPVNLLHVFRTPFPKNAFDGLLLIGQNQDVQMMK